MNYQNFSGNRKHRRIAEASLRSREVLLKNQRKGGGKRMRQNASARLARIIEGRNKMTALMWRAGINVVF